MRKKLLFLCTGNSCRSQMAEGYGKKYLSDEFEIFSAGIEKHGINPFMLKVMEEDGINMSEHYSKTLDELKNIDFDIVVTVCDHANETCPAYLKNAKIIHKSFFDPAKASGNKDEILNTFRKVRNQIKQFIKDELPDLLKQ